MTRATVERIVAWWVAALKLEAWELHIVWPEDYEKWPERNDGFGDWEPHDNARVWRAKDYKIARLYVNPDMLMAEHTGATRELESAIVHELLHLVTREAEFILDQIDGMLHRDVTELIERTYTHHVEGIIDELSYRLVDMKMRIDDDL